VIEKGAPVGGGIIHLSQLLYHWSTIVLNVLCAMSSIVSSKLFCFSDGHHFAGTSSLLILQLDNSCMSLGRESSSVLRRLSSSLWRTPFHQQVWKINTETAYFWLWFCFLLELIWRWAFGDMIAILTWFYLLLCTCAAALMSSIYEENKDEDGFLYMTYSGENTFGLL
jgi:hypothetical protein